MDLSITEPATTVTISQLLATGLFDAFDPMSLRDVEAELRRISIAAGDVLFHQGDAGDSMYVLIRGRLRISVRYMDGTIQVIDELDPGVSVGETALLTGQPRSATVSAVEDADLLQLSSEAFDRLATKNPSAMLHFAETILPRLRRTQIARILMRLFGDLSATALHDIEAHLTWRHLRHGEALFRQGDAGDALFIVVNGRLQIIREEDGSDNRVVAEVGQGESVGEYEALTGETHAESVYAVRDTDVVTLSRASIDQLLDQYPRAITQITTMIMRRVRLTERAAQQPVNTVRTFAVVPAAENAPLAAFSRRFADVLSAFGATLHLDSAEFDRRFGKTGSASIPDDHPMRVVVTHWLSEQEAAYRYVVYEAHSSWSIWTNRCIRQADRVLHVARAGVAPQLSQVETELQRQQMLPREELVLVHPADTYRPRGTREWLARRTVAAHHHVRLEIDSDLQRLARRLTGRALGLVLGGGGARGFAHLGVIRALEEAGIPVDLVGGTSIGAVIAALYATGRNNASMVEAARAFATRKQLLDVTVPLVSFFASSKVTRNLDAIFGDTQIEDLWCPYFCISSNLTRATTMVHQSGKLAQYLRASCALPGVFSPVLDNGELLVDGVAMNNVPVDVMRQLSEGGPVIAVSVAAEVDTGTGYEFGLSVSGWRVLLNRINPFGRRMNVPSIFATILRSAELFSVHQGRKKRVMADLFIYPPVQAFPTLDFDQGERLIEIGYATARSEIGAWMAAPERQELLHWLGLNPAQTAKEA